MQKNGDSKTASATHSRSHSVTVNRKSLKRPAAQTNSSVANPNTVKVNMAQPKNKINLAKVHSQMKARTVTPTETIKKVSAQELKERAIKKALASATNHTPENKNDKHLHFGAGRVMLALSCTMVVVFAIVYFVNLNMPDMSLKVAAMQSGINATYPSYIIRDYEISSISSEDSKIVLTFTNASTNENYTITEEESSWDSSALLANYVKKEFNGDYSSIREKGLTIYIDDENAAWVNNGIVYKLKFTSGSLTKKQIGSIAVSL